MFNLIQKYKQRKKEEQRINGYDWAAGALLRKEETPQSIDAYVYGNDRTAFDFGAKEACDRLIKLGIIKSDYV